MGACDNLTPLCPDPRPQGYRESKIRTDGEAALMYALVSLCVIVAVPVKIALKQRHGRPTATAGCLVLKVDIVQRAPLIASHDDPSPDRAL